MQWTDIPFDPPRTTLRQFAGLCLVVFGGMALWEALVRGHTRSRLILASLALAIGPLGLVRPEWIRWFFVGWMVLAFPIGWTVSQVHAGRDCSLACSRRSAWCSGLSVVTRSSARAARNGIRTGPPSQTPVDLRRYFKQF